MKQVIFTFYFLLVSCIPDEQEIQEACKETCADFYYDTILPEILNIIQLVCGT